ncbi:MAG TPA: lipopolysaccharide biosynthesis protein [Balneolaceae bacterium]|nr:lipopolysaccharide biosynthesis protein [Balneolaceae bacterium]
MPNEDSNPSEALTSSPSGAKASTSSLNKRVFKSAGWVLGGKIVGRGFDLIKVLILARLLTPDDFGLLGIAMLALGAMETFTQTGFKKALIQRKGSIEDSLNTAWTIQLLRGLLLAAILFFSAPLVAWFFNEPRAIPVLQVLSLIEILRGGINIGIVYFHKHLEFHKQVIYETASQAISLLIGIILAYQLRNVWALVWASLAGEFVKVLLSYVLHPFRPVPAMNWQHARQLFVFGKWILGMSILNFLANRFNRIILGRLLGTAALGFFNIADRIGQQIPGQIKRMTDTVMVPAYASVQDEKSRLERGFLKAFDATLCMTAPIAVFLIVVAPEFVRTVLGDDWGPAIIPLQILAFGGFIQGINATTAALNLGIGYPNISFWRALVGSATVLVLIYPLTHYYGIPGAAMATVFAALTKLPFFFGVIKIAGISLKKVGTSSITGVALTISTGLGALAVKPISDISFLSLTLQAFGSSLFALLTIYILGRYGRGPWPYAIRYWHGLRSVKSKMSIFG